MTGVLAEAINNRLVLAIDYPPGERLIEPHALGLSRDGNTLLRAYQVSGASASGEHRHWKLFRADRMRAASPSGGAFSNPRPGYHRGDQAMKGGIIAQL